MIEIGIMNKLFIYGIFLDNIILTLLLLMIDSMKQLMEKERLKPSKIDITQLLELF